MKNSLLSSTLQGCVLGLFFPLIASVIEVVHLGLPVGLPGILQAQAEEPLLWIIDSAPLFLGLMAWFTARRTQNLRKAAEQELEQHHVKVLGTLQSLPVGVFAVNAQGKPFFANAKALELLGKGVNTDIGPNDLSQNYSLYRTGTGKLYPAKDLPIVKALAGESVDAMDVEIHKPSGKVLLEVSSAPICDASGRVLSAVAVFHDITARQQAEEQLRQSQLFLELVVQNLPIMLFVKEAENLSFVRFNRFGEELLGVKEADMLGKSDYDFFPKDQADHFTSRDRQALGSLTPMIEEEPITSLKGGRRILRTHKVGIRDADGKPLYLLGISEDITELKQAEELNQKYLEDLQRAYKNLDQFAYIISHDLKAPMRGIRNLTDWIVEDLSGKVPESVENHIKMLQDRTDKLERLITGVLEYSRSGRRRGAAEQVQTALLVPEIVEMAGIRPPVEVTLAADMPVLHTDRLLLSQVLTNLILNGVQHHTSPEAKVHVSARIMSDDWVEFSVKDNGPGVPEEMQERIFQLFYSQDTKGQGSGIGLAIVKKIVEDQGGKVSLRSVQGRGTEFMFTWPRQMMDV